eukprot:symbB.v1.2.031133.t2/scaffold3581.1/size55290/2
MHLWKRRGGQLPQIQPMCLSSGWPRVYRHWASSRLDFESFESVLQLINICRTLEGFDIPEQLQITRELRSKARARDSRSRDRRRRRGSRDRDRTDNRGHDAQPPFSIFPRAEPSEGTPSLRLTPNTQHRSRSQERSQSRADEQDLATGHNLRNTDAPPILRRVPLPAFHAEPPPVAMTIHPNRSVQFEFNRAPPQEDQDFFCRIVQSINPSGPPQFQAEPPSNIQYCQPQGQVLPSSDSRTPPAPRGRSLTISTNAPRESREQRTDPLPIPDFLRPRQQHPSESGTETEQPRQSDSSVPARTGSQWTYTLEQQKDGQCRITLDSADRDTNPILFRFLSSQECPLHNLQQTDIYVPWLDYTIREFSHCQQTTHKMVNIWIQDPYCYLKCDQLVEACQGKTKIKDFWFKLWHALDRWKTDANSRTRRIFAAHELSTPRQPPQPAVDSYLQDHIFQKIQKMTANIRREELRPWQTAINTLTVTFSQWPNWRNTVDKILAYKFINKQKEEKHILICYYKWTDHPVLVNSEGRELPSKNYCWGHATDPSSALQIALAGGIRPASTIDENNSLYHWCPSFYCRIDGSLTHASITKDLYIQHSINKIVHTRQYSQMNHRPFIFHGIGKSRQQTHYKVVQGGVGGEYTASPFFDIVHGHDRRWLVRSHLAATMGFSV